MATYMVQVSYAPQACAAFLANPHDRGKTVAKVLEKMGGKMIAFYFSLGEYDVVSIAEMPDNVSMAAFAIAVGAGGACTKFKTTALLSASDGVKAMKKAAKAGYKTPGKK